jgi:hypothetical protein
VATLDAGKLAALHQWHLEAAADAARASNLEEELGYGVEAAVLQGVLDLLYDHPPRQQGAPAGSPRSKRRGRPRLLEGGLRRERLQAPR